MERWEWSVQLKCQELKLTLQYWSTKRSAISEKLFKVKSKVANIFLGDIYDKYPFELNSALRFFIYLKEVLPLSRKRNGEKSGEALRLPSWKLSLEIGQLRYARPTRLWKIWKHNKENIKTLFYSFKIWNSHCTVWY